jgi:serine/threonine protein kinase
MPQVEEILLVGNVIHASSRDRYSVEDLLGKGGSSTIYLVRDQRIKHNLYALKEVISPDKYDREHFTSECEILTRLEHPSLPHVYRIFEDSRSNRAYVLMDYIEGRDLQRLQKRQPDQRFTLAQVLFIMEPIIDAIRFLHQQEPPIVHRDIKPANIILPKSGEKAILVDFGIAKTYEPEGTTTAIRQCSPGFGAPEQYSIGTNPRTDIYGLGATIYCLLTGTIPIDALQRMIQLGEKEPDPLVPVNQLVLTLSAKTAEVIVRAMSTRNSARFATVEEFWKALNESVEVQATPDPIVLTSSLQNQNDTDEIDDMEHPAPLLRGKSRNYFATKPGKMVALTLVLLLLLAAAVGVVTFSRLSAQKTAPPFAVQAHVPNSTIAAAKHTAIVSKTSLDTSIYPPLSMQYKGGITDLIANSSTNMYLTSIQQHAQIIRGNFTGLGLSGSFVGTVNTAEHLQFQVTIYGGNETISFEGDIKVGGDIVGSYRILNQSQQFTGESGLWSVAPA